MVLSRFWSFIIAGSILYILILLATGRTYTIGNVVNGKQNDPIVLAEFRAQDLQLRDSALFAQITASKPGGFQQGDSLYMLSDNGIVQLSTGKQASDGILSRAEILFWIFGFR